MKLKAKEMDQLSWKILRELSENSRVTNAEIGRRVGLSAPAVAERIQKMEDQGIIVGYSTKVNLDRIGLTIKALITFRAENIEYKDLLNLFNTTSEIIEWHAVTGNDCAILKVVVATGTELEKLITMLRQYGTTSSTLILSGNSKLPVPQEIFKSKIANHIKC